MSITPTFWKGRRVFLTGHTGFKGSWLSLWLQELGADVFGYALAPGTQPSLFEAADVGSQMHGVFADIRDLEKLQTEMSHFAPEIIIHMAAQPLVRYSYDYPVETYATNVLGTVHVLEAARKTKSVRAVVNVTSDKCYENKEWVWGYRENEPMGGHDPYSNSKGCAELVTSAYRNSFFNEAGIGLASARAGNVIGGGDWAKDRLIPDLIEACVTKKTVKIRYPNSIRPWQHVLEPLSGYLLLAEKLYENPKTFSEAWNFGPVETDAKPVQWIIEQLQKMWPGGLQWELEKNPQLHEAHYLKLDCSKARAELHWSPRWNLEKTLETIVEWHAAHQAKKNMREITLEQIKQFVQ